ncbi:MAG: radical SAM protein [Muribaculaceae bacterium]
MRKSIYATVLPIGERFVLVYSATTDAFLSCPRSDWDDFIKSKSDCHYLYEKLKEIKALVEDGTDEVEEQRQRMNVIDNDLSEVHVHVNPTLNCNFNCWYCYENHSGLSKMSVEVRDAILQMVARKISSNEVKRLRLSFFGGEPLIYFDDVVAPLMHGALKLAEAKGIDYFVNFTTNGYLLSDRMLDFLAPYNVSFQITLDGYRELHDKVRNCGGKPSYDVIVRNVKSLLNSNKAVVLRINFTGENIDSVVRILEDLAEWPIELRNYLTVDMQQVWQDISRDAEDVIYAKLMRLSDYANKNGIRFSFNWKVVSVGRSCYADKVNHVLVNYNGDLYFCTARDFVPEKRKGYLMPDGQEIWENDSHKRHMGIKFSNPVCQQCAIGALCGGGCRQKTAEGMQLGRCPMGYTQEEIKNIILQRFEKRMGIQSCR